MAKLAPSQAYGHGQRCQSCGKERAIRIQRHPCTHCPRFLVPHGNRPTAPSQAGTHDAGELVPDPGASQA